MRNLGILLAATLPLVAAHSVVAQQKSPADRLIAARSLYYMPGVQGLKSFRCDATVDWKAMLTRFSGNPVTDANPFLIYLNSVRMGVDDNLNGDGKLTWTDTTMAPANLQSSSEQIRNGMVQMIRGFYQSWNQFVNGGMVPVPDSSTTVTAKADGGVHMHGTNKTTVFDEDFDKNMLLISAHVTITDPDPSKSLDNTMYPTYEASTDGLRVNRVHNVLHQPPTAPAQDVSMAVTYMPVVAYQLPATLAVTLAGTGEFDFTFSNCSINPAAQ